MQAKATTLSAKNVWGKVVLYLKEHRQVALHVACGDITDVRLEGQNLVVHVKDQMLVTMLEEGKREIESAIRWQGLDVVLVIEFQEPEKSLQEKDLEKLKPIVGDYLTIK